MKKYNTSVFHCPAGVPCAAGTQRPPLRQMDMRSHLFGLLFAEIKTEPWSEKDQQFRFLRKYCNQRRISSV